MSIVKNKNPKLNTFINPYSYFILRKSEVLAPVIEDFNVYFDGISLAILNKVLSSKESKRVSFDDTSLAPHVFEKIRSLNLRLGIIGSSESPIKNAAHIIESRYKIDVHESMHGFFEDADTGKVIQRYSKCDVVICSMGTPLQEEFLCKLKKSGWTGIGYTCGGYFDQLSYAIGENYYPKAIDKLNFRWAYRLYKEPKRLWKRYFIYYPIGIALFITDKLLDKYQLHTPSSHSI